MGIQDREWYREEMKNRAGRPVTFDQKMAASAAKHGAVKRKPGLSSSRLSNDSEFPIKTALATIVAVLLIALVAKWLLMS